MIISLVLELESLHRAVLPTASGYEVYASLLDLIGSVDPERRESLHRSQQAKPFTVSSLHGGRYQKRRLHFSEGDIAYVRYTSIDDSLSALLCDLLSRTAAIRIGAGDFSIRRVSILPDEHPWAANTSFEGLIFGADSRQQSAPTSLKVEFASPTTFRSGGANLPLPLPPLVFSEVMRKWRRHAPHQVRDSLDPWETEEFGSKLMVKRYELSTDMLFFSSGSKGQQIGFYGQAEFQLPRGSGREAARLLQLLGAFAFYSGVGYRTTWGMGQVRVIKDVV